MVQAVSVCNHQMVILYTYINRFALYGNTNKEAMLQQWNEWLSIAHSMESSIRKAAKYALGKDKVKVQVYLNSGKVASILLVCNI